MSPPQAGWILSSLAVDPELSHAVVEQQGLPQIVRYASRKNHLYQEEAAWAFANLSSSSANTWPMIESGVVPSLLRLIASPIETVRMQATPGHPTRALRPVCRQLKQVHSTLSEHVRRSSSRLTP